MAYAIVDIETRIDKQLVNEVNYAGQGLSDDEAYARHRQELLESSGSEFFPVVYHRPVVICVGSVGASWKLFSIEVLGAPEFDETTLVREFWKRLHHFSGAIVTYNGRNFDLPVLELQALRLGLSAPAYFKDRYGARYRFSQEGHYDLQDFLSNYGAVRLRGGLKALAKLLGVPGKSDLHGGLVQEYWESGRLAEIAAYCRRDVLLTYLLLLRLELLRGIVDQAAHDAAWQDALARYPELTG